MSAQDREALARLWFRLQAEQAAEQIGLVTPVTWDDLTPGDQQRMMNTASHVIAAGWTRPEPDEWKSRMRDLCSRLGFGDGVTEPMADNDAIVEYVEMVLSEARDHRECPTVCELCGENLADTDCEHCHGSGANNALSEASGAYAECEWCAGAGKIHVGCVEKTYAELAEIVAARPEPDADVVELADTLRSAADRCCQCTDGHHEWTSPYGTDSSVRISRDDARRIAGLLAGGGSDE